MASADSVGSFSLPCLHCLVEDGAGGAGEVEDGEGLAVVAQVHAPVEARAVGRVAEEAGPGKVMKVTIQY